jgi:hypothetical protein
MDTDPGKLWQDAMTRCCDDWRDCLQKALEAAGRAREDGSATELCLLQANWLAANLQRPFEDWMRLLERAGEADGRTFECLFARMQVSSGAFARLREELAAVEKRGDEESRKSLAMLLQAAYSDWLKASHPVRKRP